MTREEKIAVVYKEMANKERSIGCRINVKYRAYYHGETGGEVSYSKEDDLIVGVDGVARNGDIELSKADLSEADPNGYIEELETLVEIIGHPVMIGDVLNYCSCYISDGDESVNSQLDLLSYRGDYRQPIENQPDECIDFVFNLIE